jgi:tRNA U38,U39,U40 pseudouridine synthase TruA
MMRIAYIVIFSDKILNIKKEETHLLLNGLKIEKIKEKLQNYVGAHNIALAIFFNNFN